MKWQIPAKTFLLGEYAAIAEASAMVLTTAPCFELSLTQEESLNAIHPQSPAGLWWKQMDSTDVGLSWYDPYNGMGGLGASSAQFLACYLATCHLQNKTPDIHSMLTAYYQSAWSGEGLRPSGYDVIAQSQWGCVYINKQKKITESYQWPFKNLSFLLIHTGIKLATHHHLKETTLPKPITSLSALVDTAKAAFKEENSNRLIQAVNDYHQVLAKLDLVASHSLDFIHMLQSWPEIRAVKGCGAMGADVLLILIDRQDMNSMKNKLQEQSFQVLATEMDLTNHDKKNIK